MPMEQISDTAMIIIIGAFFFLLIVVGLSYVLDFTKFVQLRTVETVGHDLASISTIVSASDKPISITYNVDKIKKNENAIYDIEVLGDPDTQLATTIRVILNIPTPDRAEDEEEDIFEKKLPNLNITLYDDGSDIGINTGLDDVHCLMIYRNSDESKAVIQDVGETC